MKQSFLFIGFFLSIVSMLHAQKKDAAQREFDELRYHTAIERSLRQDTTKLPVISRLANAYRLTKNYAPALHWYVRMMRMGNPTAADYFNYAAILSNNGQYDSAQASYEKYLAMEKAAPVLLDYTQVKGLLTDSVGYDVFYLSINTNYDEFSPVPYKNGLVFTSNRSTTNYSRRSFEWDNKPFTDLWYVKNAQQIRKIPADSNLYWTLYKQQKRTNSGDTPPTSNDSKTLGNFALPFFKDTTNKKNRPEPFSSKINSKYHDGPATFDTSLSMIAYTSNYTDNSEFSTDGVNRLMIYTVKNTKGEWGDKVPFTYNGKDFSTAHPAFNAKGDTMYFASNRPGGYGGSDLYISIRNSTGWSQPRNLGPTVNTPADEKFPYLSAAGILYFSSDGHTGLGGLDLFKVSLQSGMPVGNCKNLGFPFNSNKDDFGFIINETTNSGYFSSNRYFSDDIFYFQKK